MLICVDMSHQELRNSHNGVYFSMEWRLKILIKKGDTMTLVKRNYRAFDNLFEELFNNAANWGKDSNFTLPSVNIHESNEGFDLELVAPGLSKEDFSITLEKGLLSIAYEKKQDNEEKAEEPNRKVLRREFSFSNFKRSFNLSEHIDADKIEARYDNGILKLHLPKKEEVKVLPKQITIS